MNIVVLDGFAADQGEPVWGALETYGHVRVFPRTQSEKILERARAADALLTNKVLLDPETIVALPRLRYVGVVATGTNVVSLATCHERGIAVTNVPGYSTHSVAQLVFALILHGTHDVAAHDARVKAGGWAAAPDFVFCLKPIRELAGKTLTVIGSGAIGRTVSELARAFGMRVLAARAPGSASSNRVPLEEALPESDYVSLHCPLTPATRHLVNAAFIARLKPGAVLVNTGRGALVDEAALVEGLRSGAVGGALLDVLEEEPPRAHHPLLDANAPFANRVVVTPHLGWATVEARRRLVNEVIENLAAFTRGESRNRVEATAAPQTLSVRPGA